jgi:hypothetical protein
MRCEGKVGWRGKGILPLLVAIIALASLGAGVERGEEAAKPATTNATATPAQGVEPGRRCGHAGIPRGMIPQKKGNASGISAYQRQKRQ